MVFSASKAFRTFHCNDKKWLIAMYNHFFLLPNVSSAKFHRMDWLDQGIFYCTWYLFIMFLPLRDIQGIKLQLYNETKGRWWTYNQFHNSTTADPNNMKFGMNVETNMATNIELLVFFDLMTLHRSTLCFKSYFRQSLICF